MRALYYLIIVFPLVSLMSCHKDNAEAVPNLTVEKYIELLKSNQFDSINIPAFSCLDIPALLKYRNETQTITNFPSNPISSLYAPNCSLGMYVLWTIESIRAVSINSKYLIMRFPSQNPILAYRASQELSLVYSAESQQIAAKAYYDWWENIKHKSFDEFKNIDPLVSTEYRWH
jgi:hypothetical protein